VSTTTVTPSDELRAAVRAVMDARGLDWAALSELTGIPTKRLECGDSFALAEAFALSDKLGIDLDHVASAISPPEELARFPLPDWAESGEWKLTWGHTDVDEPAWVRFAAHKFGEFTVDEYQTWTPHEGFKGHGLTLAGDPVSEGVGQEHVAGCSLADYVRGLATDLLAAAALIDSATEGAK